VAVPIHRTEEELAMIDEKFQELGKKLKALGISFKYDNDDNRRPGWKFAEYEAKGVPIRLAMGPRDLENGKVEVARRDNKTKEVVDFDGIDGFIENLLAEIQTNFWRLSRWLRREKFDLVHSHVYNAHVYAVLAAKLAGLPCVMHHHKTFNRDRKRRWLTLRALSKLTAVQITLSEQTRLDLLSALSLEPDNVFAISNAVDSSIFKAATDKRKIRRELGLPEAGFLMGGVASLNPQKNHAATVKMCRTLRDRCVDLHAIICGEGKLRGDLEKEISALDVGSVLRLAGNQRPIHPWLQCFDALLLPSTWEGQPLILLQALACGTPVIASRIEGNIAVLGADHLGLFDLDKPDDYANTVQKLATETSFRERLLAHQQKTLSQQPALQDYAVKLRKIYNLAIKGAAS
jgi:glycosyltransferase involved in cell wall biosynthesis